MYTFISLIEKCGKGLRIVFKLAYYKLKYGKRLKVGRGVHFRKGFIINVSKNGRLEIGDGTFFNNNCSVNCHGEITIGKNNMFGEGVKIYDHSHVFNKKNADMKKDYKVNKVVIGDRNWFGSNVMILSKAKIGDNNVFGGGMMINSVFDSDNVVKVANKIEIEKINYKDDGCA